MSAYDALRSLNKGVEQRAERQTKVSSEYAKPAAAENATAAQEQRAHQGKGAGGRFDRRRTSGRTIK